MKWPDHICFGGDYSPEQWDEATFEEDMRLFKLAHVNLLTLPVFAWAKLEPEEGVYDFAWLDRFIDRIWQNGIQVCLATSTCSQPAWLSRRYPEVLPVDIEGRKRTHGMRAFFCVNSPKYRERAAALAHEFGKRYAHHPALAFWHVSNEYGTKCYCETCQKKFRRWLEKRYGSIEELNARWNTAFWGRTVYDFDEIMLPTACNDDYRFQPAIELDYQRFVTDTTRECFLNEAEVLRSYNPEIPVFTNISGFIKNLDQFAMTQVQDAAAWDNYPAPGEAPHIAALKHDVMRGLKGGRSFILAEQSPNQQNWQPYNKLKRPGEVRRLTYQALAHGADTALFFQMRQSAAGQEKFHGALISHAGHENTRVFREMAQLGGELERLGGCFLGSRVGARTALLMDWENWWALENSSGPSRDMDYLDMLARYYEALWSGNVAVDVVNPREDTDYSRYSLVVAPMLYMTRPGVAETLCGYVRQGGTLVTTTMSGLVDENDRCVFGEYPGKLREMLGIWVEETDALRPEEHNGMRMLKGGLPEGAYACDFLCDLIHLRGAEAAAEYTDDFYKGMPVVTRNTYGQGTAWYIGTRPSGKFLFDFFSMLGSSLGIGCEVCADPGVEVTFREGEGKTLFLINHNGEEASAAIPEKGYVDLLSGKAVEGKCTIGPGEVLVLGKTKR